MPALGKTWESPLKGRRLLKAPGPAMSRRGRKRASQTTTAAIDSDADQLQSFAHCGNAVQTDLRKSLVVS
jgi:hypothetical protein